MVQRGEVQGAGFAKQLHTFRSLHPDVFAISTERLSWQRGQNLFMLFGSLVGAQQVVMIDPHGAELRKSRMSVLLGSPAKLSSDVVTNLKITTCTTRVESTRTRSATQWHPTGAQLNSDPRIMYLRSTPGPGTQVGGAASHIKGVVEGLIQLGASVEMVSNDRIAGF